MSNHTALLDANVLYPAPLRVVADLFRAKWTADIHRDLMDQSTRDCLVNGYERLIPALQLSDPDDRHVLAAAIVGLAQACSAPPS